MAILGSMIDHLVITASNLEEGQRFTTKVLGVALQKGGEHARMGTHNALLGLGETIYLEVIAPNPRAPRPERMRWFNLDRLEPASAPRLATWVVRTYDIRHAVASCTESLGKVENMSRGDLKWSITIPEDGNLVLDGVAPALIEWSSKPHPAKNLINSECSLIQLEIHHPEPTRIQALLRSIDLRENVQIFPIPASDRPYLIAKINTPGGIAELNGKLE